MQATEDVVAAAERLLAAVDAAKADSHAYRFGLKSMAKAAVLPDKPLYTITEVSKASGVPRSTLDEERKSGRLKAFIPPGKRRGWLVRCEWFDEWFEEGCSR